MMAPWPGRLSGARAAGVKPWSWHPPAPPYELPAKRDQYRPLRLSLPEDMEKSSLAAICAATCVMFVVDDSGSMQADPRGVRYAAAKSLVSFMQRGGGGRAGVVHWATYAPRETALAPVDVRKGRKLLDAALATATPWGGNDMAKALRRTKELLPKPSGGEHHMLAVITDGIEQVTPALRGAISELPADSVHILLIDHTHGCTAQLEAVWRSLPLGSFTRLILNDPDQLSWEVADVLLRSRGINLPPLAKTRSIWRAHR